MSDGRFGASSRDRQGGTASERGVSDTVGFVLVFALVTATIGVVFATGIGGLDDARRDQQVENLERAFDVLADNQADLIEGRAPSRATEIKLRDGGISFGDSVTLSVYVENTTNTSDNRTYTAVLTPIVYTGPTNTELHYVGGAVVRTDGDSSIMLSPPPFVTGNERAMLPLVTTYRKSGTRRGLGGQTTVLIRSLVQSRSAGEPFETNTSGSPNANVTVTVKSPRADAWKRYFVKNGWNASDDDPDDDVIEYFVITDRVLVPKTEIEVSIVR